MRVWQGPDEDFRQLFLTLDLECKPDHYPGIVIISNKHHNEVKIQEVQNLEKELPQLLQHFDDEREVYWDFEADDQKRKDILIKLTEHPSFLG